MSDATKMCSKFNVQCPARSNAWMVPCDDELEFEDDDLSAARGVSGAAFVGLLIWAAGLLWWLS